ncbi:GTPase ERA1, chloroplastic [Glycine max]|nr:GTPase ERA1, chloroplastic [Glycine max]
MEKLASSSTATVVPTQHFLFQFHQHSLFFFPKTAFSTFHRNRTEPLSLLCCKSRHRRLEALSSKQDQLWVSEEELELELEEGEDSYLDGDDDDDDSSFLSLSDKPDRNMAMLDDYEGEELDFDYGPDHRSGYVALLGKPNVGKSTLANQMLGQKLSIVTDKPQTTRHRILCICSGTDYQMILYDTPGVLQKEMHLLDSMMMKNVRSAAVNADCVLVLVDARKTPEKIDGLLEEGIGDLKDKPPTLLILNKKDLVKPGELAKKLEWYEKFTEVDEVIPVSAKYGQGVEDVKDWILSKLPNGPAYYPKACQEHRVTCSSRLVMSDIVMVWRRLASACWQPVCRYHPINIVPVLQIVCGHVLLPLALYRFLNDIVSEHPERFFVAEIVREKIFMQYRNEIPYACQVNVVNYKARPNAKEYIQVEILVEKNTQKIILIGREGKALKLLATAARLDVEDFLQKKVYLEIEVKVRANWRQDEGLLNHYGYGGQIRVI